MQEAPPIKTLLAFSIISALLTLGVVITLSVLGYTGFGVTYSSSSTCGISYLTRKFETQRASGFKLRFIESILVTICLAIEVIVNIRALHQSKIVQEKKSNEIYEYSQSELSLKYACNSLALMELISIFGFYLSILIQEGKCFQKYYVDWIVLMILSGVALILTLICWILLVVYSFNRKDVKQNIYKTNIGMQEIRQKQAEMNNIFEMEGSELYKTLKRQNKDSAEPLLVHNDPIPLFNSPIRRQPVINTFQQPVSKQIQSDYVPIVGDTSVPIKAQRKKSGSPKKRSLPPMQRSKVSAMIQQRKNKFRQINPLKKSIAKSKIQYSQQDYQVVDHQNMMKNLPFNYSHYIKEGKKPKRNPPNIDIILQNFNEEERARKLAQMAREQKPFLKKYRKDQQATQVKPFETQQIQFIDEQLMANISQKPQQPITSPPQESKSNEPELFFHKLRSDKNARKKRKLLFQQDVLDTAKLDESQSKQLVINKLKQAKNSMLKKANKAQPIAEVIKSPRKGHVQTKQDILLSFLKSKYLTPQKQQNNISAE